MNSSTLNYQASMFNGVMSHGWQRIAFVRDTAEDEKLPSVIDVQAQSGDYFVTLATQLDLLGSQMVNWGVRSRLEDITSDLIYLQDNYKIVKKDQE